MIDNYDWYRYNEGAGWEVSHLISEIALGKFSRSLTFQNSVRHNLSSGRAFKKMERSTGERGKGFYWSVDEQYEHMFEEQEARSQAASSNTGGKDGKGRKKEKPAPLEPALKRSVKGDIKGGALPPALASMPKLSNSSAAQTSPFTTAPLTTSFPSTPGVKTEPSMEPKLISTIPPAPQASSLPTASAAVPSSEVSACAASTSASAPFSALPASVCLPIIVGPVPPSHPSSSNPEQAQPIILHNNTLILSPTIFSHLSSEQLRELEALGAQKALEILQGHIVRYLKEKMTRGRGRAKRGRGGRGGTQGPRDNKAPPAGGPFTTTPLPPRTIQPVTVPGFGSAQTQAPAAHPPSAESVPASIAEKPPVPVPITESAPLPRSQSPIIVVDDLDSSDEGPAMKKRRLDVAI
jgi:forkhead box protein K